MTAGLYFLKLELNYLDDDAFNTELTDAQKWRYIQLYMLAKNLNEGGLFISHGKQLTVKGIAYHLHMETMVDKLQEDMAALSGIGLIYENGHGPCLARFVKEQETPRNDAERSSDKRARATDKTRGSHEPDTSRGIESESESESDIESESESEDESVSQSSNQQPTADDLLPSDLKADLCLKAGMPGKYSRRIIANDQITSEDLLAELARNYSRKGKGKGQVLNPGVITGMNLSASPIEKAADEWYDHSAWGNLPQPIKQKLGIVIQSSKDGLDNLNGLATRSSERGEAVSQKVLKFMRGKS